MKKEGLSKKEIKIFFTGLLLLIVVGIIIGNMGIFLAQESLGPDLNTWIVDGKINRLFASGDQQTMVLAWSKSTDSATKTKILGLMSDTEKKTFLESINSIHDNILKYNLYSPEIAAYGTERADIFSAISKFKLDLIEFEKNKVGGSTLNLASVIDYSGMKADELKKILIGLKDDKSKNEILQSLYDKEKDSKTGQYQKISELFQSLSAKDNEKERELIVNFVNHNEQKLRGREGNLGKLMNGKPLPEFKMIGFGKEFVKLNADGSFSVGEKKFRIAASADGKQSSNVPAFTAEVTASFETKGAIFYKLQNYNNKLEGIGTYYTIKDISDGYMDSNRQFYNKEGIKVGGVYYAVKDANFIVTSSADSITNFKFTASKAVDYKTDGDKLVMPYVNTGNSLYTLSNKKSEGSYSVDKSGNAANLQNIGVIVMQDPNYGKSLETYYGEKIQKTSETLYSKINNNPDVFMGVGNSPVNVFDGKTVSANSKNYVELTRGTNNNNPILGVNAKGVANLDFVPYGIGTDKKIPQLNYNIQESKQVYIWNSLDASNGNLVLATATLKVDGQQISAVRNGQALTAAGNSLVYGWYQQNGIEINPIVAGQQGSGVNDATKSLQSSGKIPVPINNNPLPPLSDPSGKTTVSSAGSRGVTDPGAELKKGIEEKPIVGKTGKGALELVKPPLKLKFNFDSWSSPTPGTCDPTKPGSCGSGCPPSNPNCDTSGSGNQNGWKSNSVAFSALQTAYPNYQLKADDKVLAIYGDANCDGCSAAKTTFGLYSNGLPNSKAVTNVPENVKVIYISEPRTRTHPHIQMYSSSGNPLGIAVNYPNQVSF
jgi:hypothetical protein